MTSEHSLRRYRQWYAKLLRLYPRRYRECMGESMEQTFNDLCRERRDAGQGLFGFVLWTFADTFVGILREEMNAMTQTFMKHGQIILSILAALTMIATALMFKGTERENTWLYVFVVYCFLWAGFELYSKARRKGQ